MERPVGTTAGEIDWALRRCWMFFDDVTRSDWQSRHVMGWTEAERSEWRRVSTIVRDHANLLAARRAQRRNR